MADIKVKQSKKGTIKTINKSIVGTEKFKNNIVNIRKKNQGAYQDESSSGTDYAVSKIEQNVSNIPNNIKITNKYGKENFNETKANIKKINEKIKINKKTNDVKNVARKMIKNSKKSTRTTIKTTEKTMKATKETAKTSTKIMQKTIQSAKETARVTIQTTKVAIKATVTAIKTAITGTKAVMSAIIAGRLDSNSYHNNNCHNWRLYINCF